MKLVLLVFLQSLQKCRLVTSHRLQETVNLQVNRHLGSQWGQTPLKNVDIFLKRVILVLLDREAVQLDGFDD